MAKYNPLTLWITPQNLRAPIPPYLSTLSVQKASKDDFCMEEIIISSFKVAKTVHGAKVKLHSETLERIIRKHGELGGCEHMILETVEKPDYTIKGHKRGLLAIKHYTQTPIGPKDMIVVYREDKELIITAFLTSKAHKLFRRRPIAWQKVR